MNNKLTLPLQVGKKYVRRDGVVVEVTSKNNHPLYSFHAEDSTYTENGVYSIHAESARHLDLVADFIEPFKTQGHPHAESMRLFAEDAAECAEPWTRWESCRKNGLWFSLDSNPRWFTNLMYRRKPKLIRIGIHDIHPDALIAAREQIEAVFKEQA